jgi:serine/threonine-protein kinase
VGNSSPDAEQPAEPQLSLPIFTPPGLGELITSTITRNTYKIGKELGSGNFGVVYECTDTWENELAVKVLKPQGTYEAIRENAIAEYQKLMLLRHPHITYVHNAFEYRHTFYIKFERCWKPLTEFIQRPNFQGNLWLRSIARCLLQAVHFIHVNGFAHQDIHSGNVLVSWIRDEMVPEESAITFMLGDLGISKLVADMDAQNTVLAEWMRAPESLQPQEFGPMDHRMDFYHCGLLFLQIFLAKPLTFTTEQIVAGMPRQMALELGPPFSFALEKSLRRHVPFRTGSALEFRRDLNTPSLG